jgi:hypothetical protein
MHFLSSLLVVFTVDAADICSFCQSYLWLIYSSFVIQNRLVVIFCMFTLVLSIHLVWVTQYGSWAMCICRCAVTVTVAVWS